MEESGQIVSVGAGGLAVTTREKVEHESAIAVAKRFPRDENACAERIYKICATPAFAEEALYIFPRGKEETEGLSVQAAREFARVWGNVKSGIRIVEADQDFTHIKGFAVDLETNNNQELEDRFSNSVFRYGKFQPAVDRDLRELVNRRGALLERNCIFKVIPSYIISTAQTLVNRTLSAGAKDLEAELAKLLSAFEKLNVDKRAIETYLGHNLSRFMQKDLLKLRGVYKSVSDGNSRVEEYFKTSKVFRAADKKEVSELNAQIEVVKAEVE